MKGTPNLTSPWRPITSSSSLLFFFPDHLGAAERSCVLRSNVRADNNLLLRALAYCLANLGSRLKSSQCRANFLRLTFSHRSIHRQILDGTALAKFTNKGDGELTSPISSCSCIPTWYQNASNVLLRNLQLVYARIWPTIATSPGSRYFPILFPDVCKVVFIYDTQDNCTHQTACPS